MNAKLKGFLHILETTGPMIIAITLPGIGPVVGGLVANGIAIAHTHPGTGQEKLNVAFAEIQNGVAALNTIRPGTVDPALVNDAFKQGVGATYDVLHMMEQKQTILPGAVVAPIA